ncbi:MAG: alpha-L-arabinofuranosidase C-terminal domain-containing protein [Blastocatellia bacterium]
MRNTILVIFALCTCITSPTGACYSQSPASISVRLDQTTGTIDPKIYGHFTEETLSGFEGSVWSELLWNRKFEILEERDIAPPIFKGVAAGWEPIALDTNVTLVQDTQVYFSPSLSQRITLSDAGDVPAGIQQSGYQYVLPHISRKQRVDHPFSFEPGERYLVRVAIKGKEFNGAVNVALGESYDRTVAKLSFRLSAGEDWRVYSGELIPSARVEKGKFMIYIDSPGTVWVDSVSMAPADLNEDGFRKDVIELTRRVTPTSIRWPGGWFASDYHWRDGVGLVDRRPARFNRAFNAYTTNDVGIDEYIVLCRKLGAEPYITVNFGTGTPEEAAQWVEYCNGRPGTEMGRLRAQNGHPEPYNVKLWSVGNEEYLPTLGGTSGRQYGRNFNAFAAAMRAVDPKIQLVAVGAFDIPKGAIARTHPAWRIVRYMPDWTAGVLSEAGRQMNYYSLHYYAPENVQGRSPQEINLAALAISEDLERKLDRVQKQMAQFAPGGKRYAIALDEWSLKINNDPTPRDVPGGPTDPAQLGLQLGALTLRDALAEATVFNLMHRRPDDFILGSRTLLYAYLVGLITVRRDRAISSPVALMLELYSTRDVCQSLKVDASSSVFSTKAMNPSFPAVEGAKHLNVSARLHPDGKTVDLFVVNRNPDQPINVSVQLAGGQVESDVEAAILNAPTMMTGNTFAEPHRVGIERKRLRADAGQLSYLFPAHSIIKLTFRLK